MDKNSAINNVEEKIINAAIECIEKFGIHGATNRRIATMAGVNSAAINYYFRTKEALIERCRLTTLDNAFGWKTIPNLAGTTNKEKCILLLTEFMEGGLNYPGISRFHLYDLLFEGKNEGLLTERFNFFIQSFSAELASGNPEVEISEIQIACVQMISSILLMTLTPRLFEKISLDLTCKEDRQKYIVSLVDKLITF